jgi:hypothetical protein
MIICDFCLLLNGGSCADGPCKGPSATDVLERSLIQMLTIITVLNIFAVGLAEWRVARRPPSRGRFANVREGRSKHEEGFILDSGSWVFAPGGGSTPLPPTYTPIIK